MNDNASVSMEIVDRLAESKGVEPEELDYQLQEYVDGDAISTLADHGGAWSLSFETPDDTVTITSDGEITLAGE